MKTEVIPFPNHTRVTCEGNVDGKTAPELQAVMAPLFAEHATIVLDLSRVPYMSSAGLRVLLLVHRQLAAKKGRAILVGLNESVAETMRITGFLPFFETYPSLEQVKL